MSEEQSRLIKVIADQRTFTVTPHILIWDLGNRGTRELLFASYMGQPEAVKAVSACIIEYREIQYRNHRYQRSMAEAFRRIEKPMGLGDVAHGSVYNSFFELSSVEGVNNPEKFNRALLLSPDGYIEDVLAEHVIARFGLPREWVGEYYFLFKDYITPLEVEVNTDFEEWRETKAVLFRANEQAVLEVMSDALRRRRLVIPTSKVNGVFDPSWSMSEYMVKNAEHLAKQLETLQPRHSFDRPIDPSIAQLKRIPFPIQAHVIQAIVNTVDDPIDPEDPFCGGDMGTGSAARSDITAGE